MYNSIQSDWSATLIASGIRFLNWIKKFLIVIVERLGDDPVATAHRFRIRRPTMICLLPNIFPHGRHIISPLTRLILGTRKQIP